MLFDKVLLQTLSTDIWRAATTTYNTIQTVKRISKLDW